MNIGLFRAAAVALEAMEMHGKQYSHMTKGYMIDAENNLREALLAGGTLIQATPEDLAVAAACLRNRAAETRKDGLLMEAKNLDRIADELSVSALCSKAEQ